jgi:glycine betaine/proline transport system ATP-binding protein
MEGGRVVQVGTPQQIITNPADDYVRAFFEGIDTSRYLTAGDLMQTDAVPLMQHSPQIDASSVAATLNGSADYAFVLDGERKIRGFVCRDAMGSASPQLNQIESIRRTTPLDDVVELVVASRAPLPVVEADGSYCGSVNKTNVLNVLTRHRSSHV